MRVKQLIVAAVAASLLLGALGGAWLIRERSRAKQIQRLSSDATVELAQVLVGNYIGFGPSNFRDWLDRHLPSFISSFLPTPGPRLSLHSQARLLAPIIVFSREPLGLEYFSFEVMDEHGWSYRIQDPRKAVSTSGAVAIALPIPLFPRRTCCFRLEVTGHNSVHIASFSFRNPEYGRTRSGKTVANLTTVTVGQLKFKLEDFAILTSTFGRNTALAVSTCYSQVPIDQWHPSRVQIRDEFSGMLDVEFSLNVFSSRRSCRDLTIHGNTISYDPARNITRMRLGPSIYNGEGPFTIVLAFEKTHGFTESELFRTSRNYPCSDVSVEDSVTTIIAGSRISISPVKQGEDSAHPNDGLTLITTPAGAEQLLDPLYIREFNSYIDCEASTTCEDLRIVLSDIRDQDGQPIPWYMESQGGPPIVRNKCRYRFPLHGRPSYGTTTATRPLIGFEFAVTKVHWVKFIADPVIRELL